MYSLVLNSIMVLNSIDGSLSEFIIQILTFAKMNADRILHIERITLE